MVREALDLRGGQLRGLDRAGLDGVEEGGRAIFAGDEGGEGGFLGGGWVVGPRADQRGGDLGGGVLREDLIAADWIPAGCPGARQAMSGSRD